MSAQVPMGMVALGALSLFGCATNHDKYAWGSYDPALYAYYKSPAKVTELAQTLQDTISTSDAKHVPVAPGLRAEYGYLLLQQGNSAQAVVYFRAEEQQWPESKVFMDRMIQVVSSGQVTPKAKEP
jgi:hypothetical protein